MEKVKKTWQKPELTVLVRNKPEEAVLVACKTEHTDGPRPEGVTLGNCDNTNFTAGVPDRQWCSAEATT
jgi:hypothetical protein